MLGELSPRAFLLDCLPNMDAISVNTSAVPVLHQLRNAFGPDVPIVVLEGHTFVAILLRTYCLFVSPYFSPLVRDPVEMVCEGTLMPGLSLKFKKSSRRSAAPCEPPFSRLAFGTAGLVLRKFAKRVAHHLATLDEALVVCGLLLRLGNRRGCAQFALHQR